ncbi:MAG: cytochrome b/b6 domain-containing protein [Pseudomonadota bacterium]
MQQPKYQYGLAARFFHWLTVFMLLLTVPIGFAMTYRGGELKIWDATTNALYSSHKLLGFLILLIVVARLINNRVAGTPPDEPTMKKIFKVAAHGTHHLLYLLLLLVPLTGWVATSMFPALNIFGLFNLPAIASPDQKLSRLIFDYHAYLAYALLAVIAAHIAGALFHQFVLRDGIIRRMWPQRATD